MRRRWITRFSAPVFGFGLGLALVVTSSGRGTPPWLLWAPLAMALSTAAGVLLVYGIDRWRELIRLQPISARKVTPPVVVLLFGAFATNVTFLLPGAAHANWRNSILATLPILTGIPAATAMYGVRWAAPAVRQIPSSGGQIAFLVGLRQLLRRLIGAAGAIVVLIVLQTSTLISLERSLDSPFGDRPPEYVLVFGGVGSLLIGAAYVPGWTALQHEGKQLCDNLFEVRSLTDAAAIVHVTKNRWHVEKLLGVDRTVVDDILTDLIVVSPLLASAVAIFARG
jgi:hypothetical protein